jgi:hypothetical protein
LFVDGRTSTLFVDGRTSTLFSGLKHFINDPVTTLGSVSDICHFFKSFYHELILYFEH